jgi:hypothetical protein
MKQLKLIILENEVLYILMKKSHLQFPYDQRSSPAQ